MASKFAEIYVLLGLKKEGFDKGVKETDKSLKGMTKSFKDTAIAIGATGIAIAAAGKQIYELGKRGAIVTQTADSFDYLSKKLGLAPDLLNQLRTASRGTISDMQLMSSTATLLAGTSDELGKALGQATPQLLEIAKAANKLNPSLGTTSHMYDSIALGIKRASPLILDNLGLTIKIGDANEAMAEELGKSVEALTAEEKQMALLNATLRAGDQLIAQVGGTTDSATDSFAQFETTIANLKDQISKELSPAVSGILTGISDFITVELMLNDALEAGIITQDEYQDRMQQHMMLSYDLETATRDLEQQTRLWRAEMGLLDFQLVEVEGHERAYIGTTQEATTATTEQTNATISLSTAMQAYSEKLLFNMASQNMDAEAALKLAEKLGLVDQRTIAAYKSVEFLTQKYDLNEDGVISNAEATQGYNEAIVNLSGSLGTSSGSMETNTGNAGRLGSALRRAAVDASILGQELRNASGNYSATFDIYVRKHGTISLPDPPGPQPPPGWTPPPPTGPPPGGHPDHPTGGQHGLNMVVPPGYPDDSFPILTTSGERVIVLTSAQQKAGGMTSSGNISIVRPVKTGGTMGPVGSIFGGPDPISNFLPNWVEAIGDAGDDLTDPAQLG
jgi:hypothetical protein